MRRPAARPFQAEPLQPAANLPGLAAGWDRPCHRAAAAAVAIRMARMPRALAEPGRYSAAAKPGWPRRDKPDADNSTADSSIADSSIAENRAAAGRARSRIRIAAGLADNAVPADRPADRSAPEPRMEAAADRRESCRIARTQDRLPAERRRSPAIRERFGPWAMTDPAQGRRFARSISGRVNTRNAAGKGSRTADQHQRYGPRAAVTARPTCRERIFSDSATRRDSRQLPQAFDSAPASTLVGDKRLADQSYSVGAATTRGAVRPCLRSVEHRRYGESTRASQVECATLRPRHYRSPSGG